MRYFTNNIQLQTVCSGSGFSFKGRGITNYESRRALLTVGLFGSGEECVLSTM